ncbi:MAG: 30S ribosomal protein S2 [archaeon]
MIEKKSKETFKSLADELKAKLRKDRFEKPSEESEEDIETASKEKFSKKIPEDVSDKEIEEASKKITIKDIEEEKKSINPKEETLIPIEDYIKCAVHLGTKVITPHMKKFVYKRRADGLAVINTIFIDQRLRDAIEFLAGYAPEHIYLACKREAGWKATEKFEETTGIRVFTKKYSPGITTNLELEGFFESELTIICDPWIDKNALYDTIKLKKPIISLCDTNNYTQGITKIIPCNNKSSKSIGCILYILAREYTKKKKIPFSAVLEDFTGSLE